MAKLHPQWPPGSSHFFRNKKSFFSFTFPQFPGGFQYGTPHTTFVFWGHSICCVLSSKSLCVFFCKLTWVQWWLTFGLVLKLRFRRKRDARKDFWFWDLRKFQAMWMFGVKPTDGKRWVKMCFFCILWFHERKLPKFSKDNISYKTIVGHFLSTSLFDFGVFRCDSAVCLFETQQLVVGATSGFALTLYWWS